MGKYDFDLELYDKNPLGWIANRVEEKKRILEFGPANGRLTKYLKEEKGCQVDIVEIDEESGLDAKEFAEQSWIGLEQGDIEKYYWMKNEVKYDYIIFADVLEHLTHPDEVLKRCKSVIKQDGRILVSVPNVAHNSIIIGLMKGEFQYNPTGLLDNTHLRFFTRKSFGDMAQKAGWAIVEETSKCIRVGETEINAQYQELPKEVYKELMNLEQGDVYQYIFALALSDEYLAGKCARVVSLDRTSHYLAEIQFEKDGVIDYKNSACRYYNPYYKRISLQFEVPKNSQKADFYPINANAILRLKQIQAVTQSGRISIDSIQYVGLTVDDIYYNLEDKPKITFDIPVETEKVVIDLEIIKYDFEKSDYVTLLDKLKDAWNLYDQKDKQFLDSLNTYEAVVIDKDQQIAQLRELVENLNQDLENARRGLFRGINKK